MIKLVSDLKTMYNNGYSLEEIYEAAYQGGLPLEAVEIFVNTILDSGDSYDESMDGDFDSAMASAGYGTDEDYGYYGGDE